MNDNKNSAAENPKSDSNRCTSGCSGPGEERTGDRSEKKCLGGCSKPMNDAAVNQIFSNKGQPGDMAAEKPCDFCKCVAKCNQVCEEEKKKDIGTKACDNCVCAGPCNDVCQKSKPVVAPKEILPEEIPCENCACTGRCNQECIEEKKREAESGNKVCKECACQGPCNNICKDAHPSAPLTCAPCDKKSSDPNCACPTDNVAPPEMVKTTNPADASLSTLKMAIQALQDKCQQKDIIIDTLKNEIKEGPKNGGPLGYNIRKKVNGCDVADYDMNMVAEELPHDKFSCACQPPIKITDCYCSVNPSPLQITDVRTLGNERVIVKWDPSNDPQIIGYEIRINDIPKTHTNARNATTAIIKTDASKSGDIKIAVYAFTEKGKCKPPSLAIYKV